MTSTPIVQFGTSRFLQAHADLFMSDALAAGQALGPVTVVQSSGDPSRSARVRALADPAGYEVKIRGVENGTLVDTSKTVTSVRAAYSLAQDLEAVTRIVVEDARIILSNTADAGYRPQQADSAPDFSPDMSYPAKLCWFLYQRFAAGGAPVQVMPCELVPRNGVVLRDLVMGIADIYPAPFQSWLAADVRWVNSLVDRIVSEPLEPAGAVAEPYALWAIEEQPGLILPCTHPSVQVVADLDQVETLKLYILNLGHTYMVARWRAAGDTRTYVRELMASEKDLADLTDLYAREVVPGFAAHGRRAEAEAYVASTLDRFKNPYLDHKLADIAQNHGEKVQRRIVSFLSYAKSADRSLHMPRLEALVQH